MTWFFSKRTAGKHKIQDYWEYTIYCVEVKPYEGLPFFKKVVHQILLLPFGGNIEGGPESEGSQQDANRPQYCIYTVLDDVVLETGVVLTDP